MFNRKNSDQLRLEHSSGAFIYINEGDRLLFLLLKKTNGEYDFAKGHFERGEDDEATARREILEETGLKPEFLPFFYIDTKYFFKNRGKKILKTVRYFIAKSKTKKISISKEHSGYLWLTENELYNKVIYKNTKEILNNVFEYVKKFEAIDKINENYSKLPEHKKGWMLSRRFVPGTGPVNAKIMIIGQAPGRQEDEKLLPFIGRSGILLNEKLQRLGIERKLIYITSCVQFFPPKNRIPTEDEVELCKPFLNAQIEIIKPKFIILLGSLSAKVNLGIEKVSQMHGQLIEKNDIMYMITFHPAAGLRFKRIKDIMDNDFDIFSKYIEKRYNNKDV